MTNFPSQEMPRDFALYFNKLKESPSSPDTGLILDSHNNTSGRLRESAEKRCADALTSWEEVEPLLQGEIRRMACDFMVLCQKVRAFHCDLECNIDLMDEDSVMFDWNDGTLPMFTALITHGPKIVFVGSFEYGSVKGENSTLDAVSVNLIHFVKEIGSEIWENSVLQDSWLREEKASPGAGPVYIPHRRTEDSPSSPQPQLIVVTLPKLGSMSQNK